MSDSVKDDTPPRLGLSAHVTTGVIASMMGFSATLLYLHFFPQVQTLPAPIAVVDMVRLGASVTAMHAQGDAKAFMNTGHAIAMLREQGYIVLDSRMVIAAPDVYVKKPSELVAGAPDETTITDGYVPPNLMQSQDSP